MNNLDDALETLMAIRGVEQIARDMSKSSDQAETAVRYAKDVIESIERFVTYLSITSRTGVTSN